MSTTTASFDKKVYGKILLKALPRPIQNDEELEVMTERLMRLTDRIEDGKATPEETELAELLGALVDKYEDEHYPISAIKALSTQAERVAELLAEHNLGQSDLARLLNSRPVASEILSGKRRLSKAHIVKLSEHFKVPADMFL